MSNCHFSEVSKMTSQMRVSFACLPTNLKRCCHVKLSLQWSVSNDVPNEVSFSCLPTNLKQFCHIKLSLQWSVPNDVPFSCRHTNLKQFCHVKLSLQWSVPNDVPNFDTYQSKTVGFQLNIPPPSLLPFLPWPSPLPPPPPHHHLHHHQEPVIDDQMHPVMELKAWWIACVLSPTYGFWDIPKDCLEHFTQLWEVSTKFCFLCSRKENAFLVILKLSWLWWSVFFPVAEKRQTQTQRDKARERIRVCFYCSRTWKSCVVRDVNALDLCIVRDAEQIFGVEIMTKHKVLQFFTFCILNFVQFGEGWMLLGIYVKSSWNPNKKLLKEALESATFYIGFPNLTSPIYSGVELN